MTAARKDDGEDLEEDLSVTASPPADLADLVAPLIEAMWQDALASPYLCTDATGVLVQDREKCHGGHFWIVAAPSRHVLFNYTQKHDKAAVDERLKGYQGYLVADAHAVYDHLYQGGKVIEVGCWAHTRRYFFKALETDRERAGLALTQIEGLFQLERLHAASTAEVRLAARRETAKPLVETFFGL